MGFKLNTISYILNRQDSIDNEYNELMNHYRYRNLDEVDLLELIILKARKDLINEISRDIRVILDIQGD